MLVIELDRVLNRDDMVVMIDVEVIDQAREGGAFSRPSWTSDENQAARPQHHLDHRLGQSQLFRGEFVVGDLPQNHRDVSALLKNRNAESSQCTEGKPEVGATDFLKFPLATLWSDTLHQLNRIVRLEDLGLEFAHTPVQPENWRLADDDMDVAGPLLNRCL